MRSRPRRRRRPPWALAALAAFSAACSCHCPATAAAAAAALPSPPTPPPPPLLTIGDDPLDLSPALAHDYRSWAALVARVLLAKSGGDADAAAGALGRLMLGAHGLLARAASAGEPPFPRLHLADPVFAPDADAAAPAFVDWLAALDGAGTASEKKPPPPPPPRAAPFSLVTRLAGKAKATPTFVTGLWKGSAFFNFAPCVLEETPTGVDAEVAGLNFVPRLIDISPTGFEGLLQGVNFNPSLIYVQPIGVSINPEGFNLQPGLLYFGPMGLNVQPQGIDIEPLGIEIAPMGTNIQPQGLSVEPIRTLYAPTKVCYNPQKKPPYEPVRVDLWHQQLTGNSTPDEDSDGCRRRLLRRL